METHRLIKAGASMHWPIALVIGIEVAMDDLARFDGGDCDPPNEPSPLGDEPGDEPPSARSVGQRLAVARSVVWGLAA